MLNDERYERLTPKEGGVAGSTVRKGISACSKTVSP